MSARAALRAALVDFYRQSWRLLVLNSTLSSAALAIVAAAAYVRGAIILALLLGPIAAAVMHCAVTLARTDELRLADALAGLRSHWRRSLVLEAFGGTLAVAGVVATIFYASAGPPLWPAAFLSLYLLFMLGIYQLFLWVLAVAQPRRPLTEAAADALALVLRRPMSSLGLGAGLLLINLAGAATALMPFLTLTVAYTFLATAHFALPSRTAGS